MAVTDTHRLTATLPADSGYAYPHVVEAFEARPELVLHECMGQTVDPLLQQIESSEHARNFLFGGTVLHLGFYEGEKGVAVTIKVDKALGELVAVTWDILLQRVLINQGCGFDTERISMRPAENVGKQGLTEIKIPKTTAAIPMIMLPRRNFVPMTHVAGSVSNALGMVEQTPQPPQLRVVR